MNFIRPIGSAPNMGMEGNSGKIGLGGVAYSVNMQVVGVFRGRKLSLAALTVAVAAQNVTLVKVGGKNLILGAATYSVGGQAVTMWKGWRIGTAGAVVAVGQQDVGVFRGRLLSTASATYTVGAQNVGMLRGKALSVDSVLYNINAQSIAIGRLYRITIAANTIAVNAQAVTLARYAKRIVLNVNPINIYFDAIALFKLPPKSTDVTELYNKGRGKKRFWQAVRAKEMIDPDF